MQRAETARQRTFEALVRAAYMTTGTTVNARGFAKETALQHARLPALYECATEVAAEMS